MNLSHKAIDQMKKSDIQFHDGIRRKDLHHAKVQHQERARKRAHQLSEKELCKMKVYQLYESDYNI